DPPNQLPGQLAPPWNVVGGFSPKSRARASPPSIPQHFSGVMAEGAMLGRAQRSAFGSESSPLEKAGQILRHVMHMLGGLAPLSDRVLDRMVVMGRVDEHGRHAERMRGL